MQTFHVDCELLLHSEFKLRKKFRHAHLSIKHIEGLLNARYTIMHRETGDIAMLVTLTRRRNKSIAILNHKKITYFISLFTEPKRSSLSRFALILAWKRKSKN